MQVTAAEKPALMSGLIRFVLEDAQQACESIGAGQPQGSCQRKRMTRIATCWSGPNKGRDPKESCSDAQHLQSSSRCLGTQSTRIVTGADALRRRVNEGYQCYLSREFLDEEPTLTS